MPVDAAGYIASSLVLLTFCMSEMVPLRIAALCSNVAFIVYGVELHLGPVLALHCVLIPVNAWRLWHSVEPRSVPLWALPQNWRSRRESNPRPSV
jgi:CRP/FNR family cyclic AMP-dependent transcriptional regulator